VEVLLERTGQGSRMEVSTGSSSAPIFGVGPDKMGLRGTHGDEYSVWGHSCTRQLRWLQQSLHGIRPVPVVVVDTPVASYIRPAGQTENVLLLFLLYTYSVEF